MVGSAKEVSKEKQKRQLALQKKYGQRITIARQGREAFLQKDYINATKKYNEYLSILAQLKDIEDIYSLSPTMFDNKKEVTEMLLISHIYWEIARINEMTPKLQKVFSQALAQFIKFTVNQPYQVLNAEMLRKYIKKNKRITPQFGLLNDAYQQIFVQSKKCYVATVCFGQDHEYTNAIRSVKPIIRRTYAGRKFIEYYYLYSPKLVYLSQKYIIAGKSFRFILKPVLTVLARLIQAFN